MSQQSDFTRMPHIEAGMKVGLYGGSFNPPHQGHKSLALIALKRFQLDAIWWMVTPANPLKGRRDLASLEERIGQSRALVRHPRIHITGFEAGLQANHSARTITLVRQYHPRNDFVWLMGADNLATFHLWQQWRILANLVSIGIIDRPRATFNALTSPVARALSRFRLPETYAARLACQSPPAWCFLYTPRLDISSSSLRRAC